MVEFLPTLLVASLYLAVAEHYWRRNAQMPFANVLLPAALGLHGWLLYQSLFGMGGLNLGLTNALSAIFWLTALIYQLASLRLKLHSLQAFVLPPAAIFLLLQKLWPENHLLTYADEPLFKLHLAIAFIAYSLLTFAALHALLMMLAERSLHRRMSRLPNFPPLVPMEKLLFQVITLGFILLTFTLISGIAFSEQLFHKAFVFNHKTVFAILSWMIFAALLAGRHLQGWRGRTAIRWTLAGFSVLLLAYVGSKFVLEILLGR
ncbi:MAG: inner membrane protein YpjD [Methylophilaceae bacterium]